MSEKLSLTHGVDALSAQLEAFNQLGFMRKFGARAELVDEYRVRAVIDPLQPDHLGGIQGAAVNGGVLASMFDLALGLPGLLRAYPDKRTATVQLSMSFVRALRGSRLQTESWIVRGTGGLLFTEAQTFDAEGNLCATAQGVVRMMEGFSGPRQY